MALSYYQMKHHKMGQVAFINNKDQSSCPFNICTEKGNYWLGGWEYQRDIERDYKKKWDKILSK